MVRPTQGAVAVLAVFLAAAALPAAADSSLECGPSSGFPSGNPSVYFCQESQSPALGDECHRYGVRLTSTTPVEGRGCLDIPPSP